MSRPSTKPAWPYLAREPSGLLARVGDGFQKDKNIVILFFPCTETFRFFGTKHVMIVMAIHKV